MHKHSVLKCLHIPWAKGMETIQCDLSDQSNPTQTAAAQALLLAAIFMPAEEEGKCLTWLCFCCDLGTLLSLPMTQKLEKGQLASKGQMGKAQETWCSPSMPTHGLHYIWPFISTFGYGYVDREEFSSCAGYEISPPITDLKSLKELWTNSMHHTAYLDKILWHFVSWCCSCVTRGDAWDITKVTTPSYTLYHPCVYIPVNKSEIKYKGLIKKKKKTTHEHQEPTSRFLRDMPKHQQSCCQTWRCLNSLRGYYTASKIPCDLESAAGQLKFGSRACNLQDLEKKTREVWAGLPCTPLRSLWHHRNLCLGFRQAVCMLLMRWWSHPAAWISS